MMHAELEQRQLNRLQFSAFLSLPSNVFNQDIQETLPVHFAIR
jgi:hypothetical protein